MRIDVLMHATTKAYEGKHVTLVSPTKQRSEKLFWDVFEKLVRGNIAFKAKNANIRTLIFPITGGSIRFVAGDNPNSCRGCDHSCLIFDDWRD